MTKTPTTGKADVYVAKVIGDTPAPAQEKSVSTFIKKKAVRDTLAKWDKNQKEAALDILLEDLWISGFAKGTINRVKQQLAFLEERFGTPMERKGKTMVRRRSTAEVLRELVLFALSAARPIGQKQTPLEFGVLDTKENEKMVSALTALAEGTTELVAVTRRDYNALQQLKRLLEEQGDKIKLPDGGTIKSVLDTFLPEGIGKAFTEQEWDAVAERKAKREAKKAEQAV